ncbi:hypothetical protein [Trinickia mobilis]|uniref:hypothetical protein n=1 Tax=Trinickia mobilis TaxID=2816356 RepID=UPI001A9018FC|nr:hypothetical protein [Trinickia mobilis]
MQLIVENLRHQLLPGGFVVLRFALPVREGTLRVPASTLILNSGGLRVATVDSRDEVRFKPVTVCTSPGR